MSTVIYLAALFTFFLAAMVAGALFLKWGCAWAKIPGVGFTRAMFWLFVVNLLMLPVGYLLEEWAPTTRLEGLTMCVANLGFATIIPGGLIAIFLKAPFWRGVLAWLPTLIPSLITLAFISLVFRPYFSEAFKIPTNAMAPTILGPHWQGTCPRCGSPAFCSVREFEPAREPRYQLMMCSREHRSCEVQDFPRDVHSGDHILVNKWFEPRRWDVIAFRTPENPSVCFAKRIVGLPGEEVVIRDGSVWINGERLEPPEELRGIEYLSEMEFLGDILWGHESNPARLSPDEYFVLGDFSAQSLDSRLWKTGAPGHPPYAVPESYIVGVVTHIYWPPSRLRILR